MADEDLKQDEPIIEDAGEDTLAGGEDTLAAGADDDAELSITIGDEEAADEDEEAGLDEKGLTILRAARAAAKESRREAREAKARLAELEAAQARPQVQAPKRPTLEECGFDEEVFAEKMTGFVAAQAEAKKAQQAEADAAKAQQADYDARVAKYETAKTALRVDDFEEAEHAAKSALSREQQAMIIRNVAEPEKVIYALGRSKKALAELAGIKEWDRFAFKLAKIEGEMKVTQKSPPPPESKLKGGGAGAVAAGTLAQQLARAEKAAEMTGDRTEIQRIKAQMRKAGQAA